MFSAEMTEINGAHPNAADSGVAFHRKCDSKNLAYRENYLWKEQALETARNAFVLFPELFVTGIHRREMRIYEFACYNFRSGISGRLYH